MTILEIQFFVALLLIGWAVECRRVAGANGAKATFSFTIDWFKLILGAVLFLATFFHFLFVR